MEIEDIRHQFNNTERLYHFTTFNNALLILQSHSLLFGRLKDMNDINELYRPLAFEFHPNHRDEYDEAALLSMNKDFYKYQQISFTIDGKGRKGFDIPAMWGHYANKGKGVCLVFDKNKFINRINYINRGKRHRILFRKVVYTKDYSPVIMYRIHEDGTIIPFNRKEENDYFYHKTKDWGYEQEFRVLTKTDSDIREKLDYQDSLFAIIMHNAESVGPGESIFNSVEYEILRKVVGNDFLILEHSAWFQDTQLTIKEHTVWASYPIDLDNVDFDL